MSSTSLHLRYGKGSIAVNVPTSMLMGVYAIEPPKLEGGSDALVKRALEHPIGAPRLRELAHPGKRVAILCSDLTRPCPTDFLLPYLLEELSAAGITDDEISIVIALGTHRPMDEDEILAVFGEEITRRFRILNHDVNDVVQLGKTQTGTPVEIFRPVVEADLRIALGNVEFHYYAGFSGGAKAIFPGCVSLESVTRNHAMMVTPEASTGRLEGNPVREDLEEAASLLPIDFILNVVLDADQRIIRAAAGDMIDAHRDLCQFIIQHHRVSIPRKADIVLISAGGYPKDIDLYQAHKTLEIAAGFASEGGIIIMAAECGEGFGNANFKTWFQEAETSDAIIRRLEREFVFGGHKAAAIAALLSRQQIFLISDMPDDDVVLTGMRPFESCQAAVDHAIQVMDSQAKVIFLPAAGELLPEIKT
jgi:nickel-dependent lactate racemase